MGPQGNTTGNGQEHLVDARAVAEHLSVSIDWVYRAASKGHIPSVQLPGAAGRRPIRRFRMSEIDEAIAADAKAQA